ncbi:DUF389 domain-containing protein [Streptomyces xinghaiensis]|uniref:DUF389 domain-containing protein n=1 Tax=Streptomyces xinghaiensis TaxID=1038928 RepID=UPI0002DBD131|nr:DUF389 domain-containing protein [Streptomyces xinghaiensis]MZE78204.1 DUF389 domain-containing protein [Streptomyces sp. SID5475]
MLQLRIICPADRTEQVTALLRRAVGTANLMVVPGAGRDPAGDLVVCDVAREAADEVTDELRELRLHEDGSVALQDIAVSLSRRAEQAERDAPGEPADAVLWEELSEATHEESAVSVTYLAFMTVAVMIASCGVMLDNAVLIVGAMAVGPEFGPLSGVSTGLVLGRLREAGRSFTALTAGFAVAVAAATAFVLALDATGVFSADMLAGEDGPTEFVWQPGHVSLVVALLAGIAGTLSLTSEKSGALIGVAISVTTVPAAANAAAALAYGDLEELRGSGLQLAVNLAGIIAAGALTLLVQKKLLERTKRRERALAEQRAGGGAGQ